MGLPHAEAPRCPAQDTLRRLRLCRVATAPDHAVWPPVAKAWRAGGRGSGSDLHERWVAGRPPLRVRGSYCISDIIGNKAERP